MQKVKPRIFCSKCLGFSRCRYNANTIPAPYIKKLAGFCNIATVCPEVSIGLPVPRKPLRLVKEKEKLKLIQAETHINCTYKMKNFSENFLKNIDKVDGFILKYKSPSCGIYSAKYYASMEKGTGVDRGAGLFGRAVKEIYPDLPAETDTRLTNFNIREHFLLKLFTVARFSQVKKSKSAQVFVEFHSYNKLLLLAYHQQNMRRMGKIVANQKEKGIKEAILKYENLLYDSFKTRAARRSHINVIEHAAGYFSKKIKNSEKKYINKLKKDYKNRKLPLSALRAVIGSYIIRFDIDYLKKQTYFDPYPSELVEVNDSGKGRDLKHI